MRPRVDIEKARRVAYGAQSPEQRRTASKYIELARDIICEKYGEHKDSFGFGWELGRLDEINAQLIGDINLDRQENHRLSMLAWADRALEGSDEPFPGLNPPTP
jgi:hypothetical protein